MDTFGRHANGRANGAAQPEAVRRRNLVAWVWLLGFPQVYALLSLHFGSIGVLLGGLFRWHVLLGPELLAVNWTVCAPFVLPGIGVLTWLYMGLHCEDRAINVCLGIFTAAIVALWLVELSTFLMLWVGALR